MARAADKQPQIVLVDSSGSTLEGPYVLAENSGAPALYGWHFEGVDPWDEDVHVGPWENFQWQQMSYSLGYRLHATLKFTMVESDLSSNFYGLTLLHRLWKRGREQQVSYAGLQFKMFTLSAWRPIIITSPEWRPVYTGGDKQGYYDVSFDIATRDLVATPGEWAQQQW